jgi:hypothetical protein
MITYALVRVEDWEVMDIFSCENRDTLDGYQLPPYELMLVGVGDNPPQIGEHLNPETGQFY